MCTLRPVWVEVVEMGLGRCGFQAVHAPLREPKGKSGVQEGKWRQRQKCIQALLRGQEFAL